MSYLYTSTSQGSGTSTSLSTQILIQVDGVNIGAIQEISAKQNRPVKRIGEVGTDGFVDQTPSSQTEVDLQVTRIVFDRKSLTEAFGRPFVNIHSQRIPFDIVIYDFGGATNIDANGDTTSSEGVIQHVYENCWFTSLDISYSSSDYIISQSASIQAEFVHSNRDGNPQTGVSNIVADGIEKLSDSGRRGSMDSRGINLIQQIFSNDTGNV